MSERWKGPYRGRWLASLFKDIDTPFGMVKLHAYAPGGDCPWELELPDGKRLPLHANEWDAAITEAERIIADRCRETLKLLGE